MHTMEYYLALKRYEMLIMLERMNFKNIMLSKITQTQKNKY